MGEISVPTTSLAEIATDFPYQEGRVSPHTLLDTPSVRVIHIALDVGTELKEHMTSYPIVVEVIEGTISFGVNAQEYVLEAGGMIHVEAKLLHAVRAITQSRINIMLLKVAKA